MYAKWLSKCMVNGLHNYCSTDLKTHMLNGLQHMCQMAFNNIVKTTFKMYAGLPSKYMVNGLQHYSQNDLQHVC